MNVFHRWKTVWKLRWTKMLPGYLRSFRITYYCTFLYGVFPFGYHDGKFVVSRYGIELWTAQLAMTLVMNYSNYIDSLASPCSNALSCAVYIQTILNGITVVVQVLLIIYNRNHIMKCLTYLNETTKMSEEIFHQKPTLASTKHPVVYNLIFTTFTVGRCLFMFIIKPKTSLIQMVQYLCTVTQIQIENLTITLTYIAANHFVVLNEQLSSLSSSGNLQHLQKFHLYLFKFCKQIEKSFGLNITISVFTVLTQLLLMTFFETTLNIRPLKRNLMMDLYLVLNVLYAIVNLARVAAICRGCDLVHDEYKETSQKLEKLIDSDLPIGVFTSQVQLLKFRFTGCNLFVIGMELITEIVSAVSIYATTIVSFTTFASDTSAVYSTYIKKGS